MKLIVTAAAFLFGLTLDLAAQRIEPAYPASTAAAEGLAPAALAKLDQLVASFVKDEEIVGAELMVIKNGRSVLHQAYGWRNREAKVAMEVGSVFCVRSMTKPLIGASILMLIDDKKLTLEDRVAKFLPSFDVAGSREITVDHLLTHTSGLPMSLILGKDLSKLNGIRAVAALGGGHKLNFSPGRLFSYSDQGTDTLTALIEVVTGKPAADFVRDRILEPMGMRESACVMTKDHPLRARASSKYGGSRGAWSAFWSPEKPPLFPFFLGSQGLYSTLPDYARFMDFWLHGGVVGGKRLLDSELVELALTPSPERFKSATGFPGLAPDYGSLMQLWRKRAEGNGVVVFGHSGSDGTHAWGFPEHQATVLYFTQSRGNLTGLRVEEALGELFLGVPVKSAPAMPPFEQFLGYYAENASSRYQAIIRDGRSLALETPGKRLRQLTFAGEDRWKFRHKPSVVLTFERAKGGEVSGFRIGDHREFRFQPPADLPSLDTLVARVVKVHRIDLLASLGPMLTTGKLTMAKLNIKGEVTSLLAWPNRFRVETVAGAQFEREAFDGTHAWYAAKGKPIVALEGDRGTAARQSSPMVRFGDWRLTYPRMRVIQRLEAGGKAVFVVRAGDTSATAPTLYVEVESGRVIREERITQLENLGRVGVGVTFGDYREVSGMLLPFRSETRIAHPLLGPIVVTVEEVKLGVEVKKGAFMLQN